MTQPQLQSQKSIVPPSYWKQPMYRFGQLSRQGFIVGMEYVFPDIYNPQETYCGWNYTVSTFDKPSKREIYNESKIELLSPEEINSFIKEKISTHQNKINSLNQILGEAI